MLHGVAAGETDGGASIAVAAGVIVGAASAAGDVSGERGPYRTNAQRGS